MLQCVWPIGCVRSLRIPLTKKALFVNSGAEAVGNAVKIARYYNKRQGVVAFDGSYHGRTYLTMTTKVKPYKCGFGPLAPEVYRAPFGDFEAFTKFFITGINPENTAAVVIEPIQGAGGFMPRLRTFCPRWLSFVKTTALFLLLMRSSRVWAGPARCLPLRILVWNRI